MPNVKPSPAALVRTRCPMVRPMASPAAKLFCSFPGHVGELACAVTSASSALASAGYCAANTTADAPATAAAADGCSALSFSSSAAIAASYCASERYAKSRVPPCWEVGYLFVRPRAMPFHATVARASLNCMASDDGDVANEDLPGAVAESAHADTANMATAAVAARARSGTGESDVIDRPQHNEGWSRASPGPAFARLAR